MKTQDGPSKLQSADATAASATYITDLTHFLDENGHAPIDAPKQLLEALDFFGGIVKAASSHTAGTELLSTVPCRREPAKSCLTITNGSDGTIRWECPDCGENGCISRWQGSSYDLSEAVEPDAGNRVGVHVTAEEHRLLREIITSSQEADAIIAGGIVTPKGVWLSGRIEDFDELLGSIAFDSNHAESAKRQRAMDQTYGKIEKVVEGSLS